MQLEQAHLSNLLCDAPGIPRTPAAKGFVELLYTTDPAVIGWLPQLGRTVRGFVGVQVSWFEV